MISFLALSLSILPKKEKQLSKIPCLKKMNCQNLSQLPTILWGAPDFIFSYFG
jgi:hypothetical protein